MLEHAANLTQPEAQSSESTEDAESREQGAGSREQGHRDRHPQRACKPRIELATTLFVTIIHQDHHRNIVKMAESSKAINPMKVRIYTVRRPHSPPGSITICRKRRTLSPFTLHCPSCGLNEPDQLAFASQPAIHIFDSQYRTMHATFRVPGVVRFT